MDDEVFGNYRLVAGIGRGGMADVFLAVSSETSSLALEPPPAPLVVKRIRRDLSENAAFVSMFLDEARLAVRLRHENVVRTLDVGEVHGRPFLVMELLHGQPLHKIQQRARERELDLSALEYFAVQDVLTGLHHAHELCDEEGAALGVVHRDVGPHNVIVLYDGTAKLVDFGIAKAKKRAASQTTGGVIKGKVRYMAPEQALSLSVDRRADVFSAGVMIWEAAARRAFWPDAVDDVTVAVRLAQGDYPASPREVGLEVPDAIDVLCKKALARDPAERHATAAALREELVSFLATNAPAELASRVALGSSVADLFVSERRTLEDLIIETRRPPPDDDEAKANVATTSEPRATRPAALVVIVAAVALASAAAGLVWSSRSSSTTPATAPVAVDPHASTSTSSAIVPPVPPTAVATTTTTTTTPTTSATPVPLPLRTNTATAPSPPRESASIAATPSPRASASANPNPNPNPNTNPPLGRSHLDRDPDPWAAAR